MLPLKNSSIRLITSLFSNAASLVTEIIINLDLRVHHKRHQIENTKSLCWLQSDRATYSAEFEPEQSDSDNGPRIMQ